ncbi:unnamed protein product (macronuclear) [Paramecium tetraurelia]|uniref:Protein kinase domain-containing protein n=1 Tax=Paramecium tetraurelia TaxID=5888 RepID=A0D9C1_PARTE|nr:uncharacterized protein GSPATT00014568001 [Paramecium tetraurelia]CAK79638.1 unnamed protein product [Paramecium tetraurelia]|eukprot:XP_001447035.1 hypothetical protein (macronuclear) [Paramecium tetraurelia strain d4-2]
MGNLQTLINYHAPLNYSQDLSDQLIDQGMLQHPGLGQIQLWKIKESNLPLLFSFHVHVFEKDSSIIDIHNFRSSLKHPNLIEYFACTSSKALNIGKVQSQQFFFAYYPETLKQYIQSRTLTEVQIWNIIEQIVNLMVYLQNLNRYHSNINSESIFINDNLHIKMLDKIGQKPNKIAIKDDVRDLGIVIIELLTKRTNQLNFIQQIKNLHGKFTLQLLQLVAKMIDENIDKRPDFIQIQRMINNRFKEPIFFNNPERNANLKKLTGRLSTQEPLTYRMDEMKINQLLSPIRSSSKFLLPFKSNIPPNIVGNNPSQQMQCQDIIPEIPPQNNSEQSPPRKIYGSRIDQGSTAEKQKSPIKQMSNVKNIPYTSHFQNIPN